MDIALILVILTSIAIGFVIAGYIYKSIQSTITTSDIATPESTAAYNSFESAFHTFDFMYSFILFGLIIALIISSLFIPTHPVFVVINIFGFLILVFLGAVCSNLYSDLIATEGLNVSAIAYFPITTFVATKLPWIGAFTVFIMSVIMYGRSAYQ